jgi:hypothetical protein
MKDWAEQNSRCSVHFCSFKPGLDFYKLHPKSADRDNVTSFSSRTAKEIESPDNQSHEYTSFVRVKYQDA